MDWFSDDVAVVTGGSSGNGRQISHSLAEYGADIIVADIRSDPREGGRPTHEAISDSFNVEAEYVECDVASVDDIQRAIDTAEDLGGVSIMVNNAGVTHSNDFLETTEDQYRAVMDVNLKGAFFGAQRAARSMISNDREGRIINIASISGLVGRDNGVRYSASKGGVRLLTYALAASLGPRGIRVNAINPGLIETQMAREDAGVFNAASRAEVKQEIPANKIGQPKDVANAILYLAGPLGRYVNGEDITIDGGSTHSRGDNWVGE